MAVAETEKWSLHLGAVESSRLAWAFAISLGLHLLVFGTYEAGSKFGWWQNFRWPAWVRSAKLLSEILKTQDAARRPPPPQEVPLLFLDVSAAQAVTEPPKDAKYYSDKNSKAANTQADQETDTPKISGQQQQMARTEDAPRQKFVPLQPAPLADPAPKTQDEEKAKPAQAPGDLAMMKPDLTPRPDPGQAERARPRTIQEARARLPEYRSPAEKMQQKGGVQRHLKFDSLDAKATPFGLYDALLIRAVESRWFALLDERAYASDARGKVVLQFVLHQDGRITDMTVSENTTSEVLSLICQRAVLDPAPFEVWPAEMRRMAGETRNIQFTFYYN